MGGAYTRAQDSGGMVGSHGKEIRKNTGKANPSLGQNDAPIWERHKRGLSKFRRGGKKFRVAETVS